VERSFTVTSRNRPSRHPERVGYDADTVQAVLDEGLVAHVAFVVDGLPQVLPMLYVRLEDAVYLHGSTGSHIGRLTLRNGRLAIAAEVTLFDEMVLARSTFNHSVNYRTVVVHGSAVALSDADRKAEVLAAMVERLVPGRGADARPPAAKSCARPPCSRCPSRRCPPSHAPAIPPTRRPTSPSPASPVYDRSSRPGARSVPPPTFPGIEVPSYLAEGRRGALSV
jgi:nitroimidazol reductase NimA-like FMN-containing flavoprotein (pyridoxamine 5'-phosphate oxidase superfamily)